MTKKSPNVKKNGRQTPYSLPASSFYFLVSGLAVSSFFLVILIFHEGGRDYEWVAAGLVSGGVLIAGVILREVVLRSARERHLARRTMLDRNLNAALRTTGEHPNGNKFTLEQNAAALETIKSKSDAAKIFIRISAGHKEVFEICEEYRRIVAKEIPLVHPDSPRLMAMIRGNAFASELQEFHLLRWAAIESKALATKAKGSEAAADRNEYLKSAIEVIDFAMRYYPENKELKDSLIFLADLAAGSEQSSIGDATDEPKIIAHD